MTDLLRRPNRPRCAAAVYAAAALALLVAGCSGGGGEEPSSSASASEPSSSSSSAASSASPSDSTAPSPTESGSHEPATSEGPARNVPVPEMPDAVKEPTEEGAEAAVEYWWEATHYLRSTGNADPLKSVSADECGLCVNLVTRWTEIYELGGWAESEPASVSVQFVKIDNAGTGSSGAMIVSEAASQIYQPDGSPGGSGDGSDDRSWVFSAEYDDEETGWQIAGLEAQG
ncbi:DUF6318 family protein [Citricoccus nitrophenolicus]|uniref:DUF6318 family protein n=1 Tax=Citricoccus nitrophenolicus TaxID=863575 RepID=A0ABV0IDN1_9MICC